MTIQLKTEQLEARWAANFDARARRLGTQIDKSGLFAQQHGRKTGLVVVTGDKAVDARLALLIPKAQRKIVRTATRKAVKEISLPEAKRRSPVSPGGGALRRSLAVRAKKRSRRLIGHSVVTRGSKRDYDQQYYGAFPELGTKHQKAQPYLRPAIYDQQSAIRQVFFAEVRRLILEA